MQFDFNFYSSILLLFFTQGVLYSILVCIKGRLTEIKSNYWLSFLLLLCSLYLAPWMLGFGGWYDNQPYRNILFYIPFQHLFLIGPTIYFYTQSLLNPAFTFSKINKLHYIPGLLYLSYIICIFIYDVFIVKEAFFYSNGMDKDFDFWYQKTGLVYMIFYFVLSLKYYNAYKKLMFQVVSFAESILFRWVKHFLIAFLVMLILPILFDVLALIYPDLNSYVGSWWFYLLFAICMLYIAISGYSNHLIGIIPFEISVFDEKPKLVLDEKSQSQTETEIETAFSSETSKKAPSEELIQFKLAIENLMQVEEVYKDPALTLTDLAKKLETNAAVVSKAVNQNFNMNFNDFINFYRIEHIKLAFQNKEHVASTLLGIAFDSGFNSKATFNRAFKKHLGVSPKDYIQSLV